MSTDDQRVVDSGRANRLGPTASGAADHTGDVVRFHGKDAVAVKKSAGAVRAEATRAVAEIERQQSEMKAELDRRRAELEADFQAKRAELAAKMGPLRQQLEQMQEVMWTVDLYLGRDESLRLLRDGTPAAADTPITIRQKVLVMAEESLVLMDRKTTGMDADDIPEFVNWLLDDPAHLDRVLPEQRGVVVLIPTRVESRTGNPLGDTAKNAANQSSWWLLRNGERIYLLTVDPELRVTQRVLPRRDEFTEVFGKRLFGFGRAHGEPIIPGSQEWLEMEKKADARRRHYMRILLVLQGIIDRTPVWHPLPATGVNLLSLSDQDNGKIVLLQDDEDSIQLTDGRESFRTWQRRLNGLLRPGLRIIGNWRAHGFADLHDPGDRWTRAHHPRLSPPNASYPPSDVPHLIEDRRDGGFVIRYARTDEVWKRNVPVPDKPGYVYRGEHPVAPARRASCVVMPDDGWVLPYDLVTVDDLTYYLNSRDNRSQHFLSMVPVIKAALAAKQAEAEAEAPFRDLIGRVLITEGADSDDVKSLTDELVQWWKIANTWSRPLIGEPEHEAKAVRDITREYQARVRRDSDGTTDAMITAGRRMSGVIAVARNRQGKWHAYAPSSPAHDQGVFLDIAAIRSDGTLGTPRTWQTVAQRTASLLQVAWSTATWNEWKFTANPRWYLTAPERDALIAETLNRADGLPICVTEFFNPATPSGRVLISYSWAAGTPESAPLRDSNSPLSWHAERGATRLVTAQAWLVTKDKGGARLAGPAPDDGSYPSEFAHFSAGGRWGNTPWWPDDAAKYPDVRPRLVWSDIGMLDRIAAYADRCAAAYRARREERRRADDEIYRYVNAVAAVIRDEQETRAKARFLEDYGHDASDLWPAHLKSLGLPENPIHPRTLWGLIAIAMEHGHPVIGQTLESLADYAWTEHQNRAPGEWHPERGRPVNLSGYGHIMIPMPEENE
ncbi:MULTISPECIES: OmpH family outer membrane protein [unclassified Mycolicibacterium]|uniref:OmpH family outer membrane protein n=1 Tax=unclassified Mycolicibacterium TaxID=2636767 RepID=UPI001BB3CBEE|nr:MULTISPECIES: OmpH family outer membrane protein [unclassified Mycolicibacterium]